jgi:hypothetical protein
MDITETTETSLRDYNEAIRLKPDYAEAFYNRKRRCRSTGIDSGALAFETSFGLFATSEENFVEPDLRRGYHTRHEGGDIRELGRL